MIWSSPSNASAPLSASTERVMKFNNDQMNTMKEDQDEKKQQLIDLRNEMNSRELELKDKFNGIIDDERAKLSMSTSKCAELDAKLQKALSDVDKLKSQHLGNRR